MASHRRTDLPRCRKRIARGLATAGMLLFLTACATTVQRLPANGSATTVQSVDAQVQAWTYVRFRLRRDDEQVNSFLDTLIADQILAPVIARHEAQIGLWRFHRRWARDTTGHQFSFIFFASATTAEAVSGEIRLAPALERLRADGHLLEFRVDALEPGRASDPAATSDSSWPTDIQREWPKFIMGASRMWLGLVQSEAARHRDLELYARYRAVETALGQAWHDKGNHAFFHHLSALFGYKPLKVRTIRTDVMTF